MDEILKELLQKVDCIYQQMKKEEDQRISDEINSFNDAEYSSMC